MKTIFQLAKLARRIKERSRRLEGQMKHAKSAAAQGVILSKQCVLDQKAGVLNAELSNRNIGGKEYRNTVTPAVAKKRAIFGALKGRIAVASQF